MAAVQNPPKVVLLFSPGQLAEGTGFLESLHITKEAGSGKIPASIRFDMYDLSAGELQKQYGGVAMSVRESLAKFNKAGIEWIRSDIQKRFAAGRSGQAFEPYFKTAFARKLQEMLDGLRPVAGQLKFYHKIPAEKGRYKTAPCQLSDIRPSLDFVLRKEGELVLLDVRVKLGEELSGLDGFVRSQFLLERGSVYYLLAFKDYQTLEWLQVQDPGQYGRQPGELASVILSRLEQDYKVDRGDVLEKNEVKVPPVNRVLLSEISGSFLVLTPQWVYDGFIVEGAWKERQEIMRQGVSYVVERDQEAEKGFSGLLESLHANFAKQLNGYYYLSFADAQKKQWFLKVYHKLLEEGIQVAGMDMLNHFRYSQHKPETDMEIGEEGRNTVAVKMRVRFGEEEVGLGELQKMLLAGQRAVLLKDGSLGILSDEWLDQYSVLIRHGKVSKKEIQAPKWLAFAEKKKADERLTLQPVLSASWWDKWQQWQEGATEVYTVPASVQASLRPYQQKGFEWLLLLAESGAGACLADDMGLGKTLQTISYLAFRAEHAEGVDRVDRAEGKGRARFLIVCPSSLIYNWQAELQKFAPSLSVMVYHGTGRVVASLESEVHSVIITSYGTMRVDIEHLQKISFDTVVLDESHTIKNPAAQVTKAVGLLQGAARIALSGTPVMNNTFDLYAQLDFLLPGLLGSREFFRRQYADAIDRDRDEVKIKMLNKLTAPFVLRRTKEQVAGDLPPKTEIVMWCDMSSVQRELYDSIKDSIRSSLFLGIQKEGLNKSKLAVLQGMLKLRQVCNSPLLLPQDERTCRDSVKTELLINELSDNLKDRKVLVFSQFATMLDLLAEAFDKEGIRYYHFDGQTPPAKRAEMVETFQDPEDGVRVFLISLKAGNAGLNLTAADYVFLVDPWWNTAVQNQAIDRAHRIGQMQHVFAYKMICKGTIEEKILELQQRKKQLAQELVSDEEWFVKSLTEDEIKYLFS